MLSVSEAQVYTKNATEWTKLLAKGLTVLVGVLPQSMDFAEKAYCLCQKTDAVSSCSNLMLLSPGSLGK